MDVPKVLDGSYKRQAFLKVPLLFINSSHK